MRIVPAHKPAAGTYGGVDFRYGSLPVVVMSTDGSWHDDYGFSAPKLKTDILGQTIPAGRKTAPSAPQTGRRAPRKLVFLPAAKNGKKKK